MSTVTLGPFSVAPDGSLHPPPGPAPAAIDFAWRGQRCHAAVTAHRLLLAAGAGRIPSTAEGTDRRKRVLATLRTLPGGLPSELRLRIGPDHAVRFESERRLPAPPTAIGLVAAMVEFVLALDPYLDALAGGSGNAKT